MGSPQVADGRWRVGLIGAGVVSSQYLESLQRLDDLELVAVADLDASRAAAVASEYGVRAQSVDEVIGADDIDVILNLTVPAAHVDISARSLDAGKHVYVEKPFSLTVPEGQQLLDLAQGKGLRIGCAPDTVLGTGVQTARQLIDDGRIGTAVGASANWSSPGHERWHTAPEFYYQPGGGPLFDMGPYYISALVTLLGPIERVTASARRSARDRTIATGPRAGAGITVEVDTHVTAIAEHVNGAVSTLMVSFEVWGSRLPRIEVYGTEGTGLRSGPEPVRGHRGTPRHEPRVDRRTRDCRLCGIRPRLRTGRHGPRRRVRTPTSRLRRAGSARRRRDDRNHSVRTRRRLHTPQDKTRPPFAST